MSSKDSKPPPKRTKVERGIHKRASGRLEIAWRDADGKQRFRTLPEGDGILAARRALADEHARRGRGEKVAADRQLRFNAAADLWWEARALKLRPATQSAYGASLKHLRAHFGRRRMADITAADVAAYVTARQRAGQKGWTIKGQLTALSAVFTYAGRHLGLVGASPVSLLDRVERPSTEDEGEKRILTHDELRRLLASVDDGYRALFSLAAETGARLSETLGLVWENVDLDEQTVTFTHQLSRKGERVLLKTKRSRRVIEVTPQLAATLRAHKIATPYSGPHDFAFASRVGTGLDQRHVGGRVLGRAVKRAGLEAVERNGEVVLPAPTFHDLRHTHASALIASGWDIAEISARLGHASVSTTMDVYSHQFDAARRSEDRRSRLSAMYGGEAQGEAPDGTTAHQTPSSPGAEILDLQEKRHAAH